MRNLIFTAIFAVVITLSFTQYSEAVCTQNGNTPEGGNIIDCGSPVQNSPLDIDTNPATTALADEINILTGGGINTDAGNALSSRGGADIINVRGDMRSIGGNAIRTGGDDDILTIESGNIISTTNASISTVGGNDTVVMNGGFIQGLTDAIRLTSGDDTAIINGGELIGLESNALDTGTGNDNVTINGGHFEARSNAVALDSEDDTLTVNGGMYKSTDSPIISSGTGDDVVTLNGGFYMGEDEVAVRLGGGDDTLTLGGDIDLDGGIITCGSGFDTLIFAMGVPLNRMPIINEAIANLSAPDGQIVINGISYVYRNCEQFVNEITEPVGLPIPTLSEWGMIAMAGVIGIAGILFYRRRLAA